MNIDADLSDDDISSAMGTETLLARDLVPAALPTSTKVSNPVWKEEHFSLRIQSMEEAAYIHGVQGYLGRGSS